MDNRRPFFEQVGEHLMTSTGRRFALDTAPDGTKWAPLKPGTIKSRIRRGKSPAGILRDHGLLRGSISAESSNDDVRIGSPSPYAAIHQLGGTIDMPARQQTLYLKRNRKGEIGRRFVSKKAANHTETVQRSAHKLTITARPFLGISAADQQDILDMAGDWLGLG